MATPLALVFELIARDGASPVFNRVAASADRAAVATGRAEKSVVGIGGKMKAAFAGLAIGAVAVEAVKAASQFQKSMLAIQTQAGASAREVKTFSSALLTLGPKVATGPEALSVSMYHVYSALKKVGADGPQMLNAVKIAAEGAKVGNTDLEDTTNSLTATLASGIVKFNQAGKAMGYLNAIVGAGDMKFSDLNQALGTGLLVTMKTFGVSLNDTGAALAVFGDNNIRGADAATKLRMSVQDLAKPAAHAGDYLAKIHLTTDQLRTTLTEHGLNDALHLLKTHLDAAGISGSKVGAFLEDAFTKKAGAGLAVLLTRMDQFDEARKTEQKGANSFGAAWKATTKTASFQFDKIKAQIEAFGISLGTKLLPYVTAAAQWLGTNLPKAVSLIGQILGPLARLVGGALAGAFRALVPIVKGAWDVLTGIGHFLASNAGLVKNFALAIGALWAAFKGYSIAVAALSVIPALFRGAMAAGEGAAASIVAAINPVTIAIVGVTAIIVGIVREFNGASDAAAAYAAAVKTDIGGLKPTLDRHTAAITQATQAWVEQQLVQSGSYAAAKKLGLSLETVTSAALGNKHAMGQVAAAMKGAFSVDNAGTLGKTVGKILELGDATNQSRRQVSELNRVNHALKSSASDAAGTLHVQTNAAELDATAQLRLRDASNNLKDAQKALNGVLTATTRALSNAAAAVAWQQSLNDLTQTIKTNKGALAGHTNAALADKAALLQNMQTIDDHANQMHKSGKSWQDVTGYITKQYGELRQHAAEAGLDGGAVDDLAKKVKLFPPDIKRKIQVDTAEASTALDNFRAAQANAAIRVPVTTYFAGGFQVGNIHTGIGARAAGGPIVGPGGPTADRVPIMASNGEHVLTASDVEKAGGQGAVYRMRQAIQSGALKFARGGAVSSLMSVIRRAGFSGSAADVMYGIVEAESGGNRFAHNTNSSTGDNSYGLAQINMIGSMGPARRAQFHLASNNALFDPLTNLRVAYSLSSHGRNFSPWTTFTSGAYRQFLNGPENARVRASGSGADALSAARTRAANIRSNSLSRIDSLLGGIGSAGNGPQINVGSTGIRLVERQIAAARRVLAGLPGLSGPERAKYNAKINELVQQAQRQFDKLKLHIKNVDLSDVRKALKGTAADARKAFGALITDLRHIASPDGLIARLRRQEGRLLPMIRERNRAQSRLDSLTAADKSLQNSVKSSVTGFFDVTSAGTNPVTGQINAGSMIAQQRQDLIKIKKFGADLTKLGRRGLNHDYLRQLASAGPSVLPQLEALLQMSASQFAGFNRTEGQIQAAGAAAGQRVGHDIYGARERAARHDERVWNRRIDHLAHVMAKEVRHELEHAHITAHIDGRHANQHLDQSRKRHNDLHGTSK